VTISALEWNKQWRAPTTIGSSVVAVSRKRIQKQATVAPESEAIPEEVLAEGSGELEAAPADVADTLDPRVEGPIVEESMVESMVDELAAVEQSALDDSALDGSALDGSDDDDGGELPSSAASMDGAQLKQLVEALVFASDKPITVLRLRQLTRVSDVRRLEQALAEIAEDYQNRGLILQQVSGGYQFRTRPQFSAWVQQLIAGRPVRLSRAQLETLAIIAYRQPITRPEIDEIRGVDSSGTLKVLIERSLIRILGKKEEVGRPMLYGTTKEFLDFFSLGDLRELPTLREYFELTDESRQVMSDRLGPADEDDPAIEPAIDPGGPVVEAAPEMAEPMVEAPAADPAIE
jgi:segregation and condensation protein B